MSALQPSASDALLIGYSCRWRDQDDRSRPFRWPGAVRGHQNVREQQLHDRTVRKNTRRDSTRSQPTTCSRPQRHHPPTNTGPSRLRFQRPSLFGPCQARHTAKRIVPGRHMGAAARARREGPATGTPFGVRPKVLCPSSRLRQSRSRREARGTVCFQRSGHQTQPRSPHRSIRPKPVRADSYEPSGDARSRRARRVIGWFQCLLRLCSTGEPQAYLARSSDIAHPNATSTSPFDGSRSSK